MARREPSYPPLAGGDINDMGFARSPKVFPNVDALKEQNMSAVKDEDIATVIGSEPGDYIEFVYDPNSSDADDSGDDFVTTVEPNKGGGRWKRLYSKTNLYSEFISDTKGSKPSSNKAVDGVLGLYEDTDGYYQFLKYDEVDGWEEFGSRIAAKTISDTLGTRLDTVEAAQSAGVIGYGTKAEMDDDDTQDTNTLALVTNDPTEENNNWYRYDGSDWKASDGFFASLGSNILVAKDDGEDYISFYSVSAASFEEGTETLNGHDIETITIKVD